MKTHADVANEILRKFALPVREAQPSAIVRVIEETGLGKATADAIMATFNPLTAKASDLMDAYGGISITDATDVSGMKHAREGRLLMRKVRIDMEKARKAFKDDFLRGGKAIDSIYHAVADPLEKEEARLEEQEKFAERAEAARKAVDKARRAAALRPYTEDVDLFPLDEMSEPQYLALLQQYINLKAANELAARQAEEARLAAETKRLADEAAIREENFRLQKEAADRQLALDQEMKMREAERKSAADEAKRQQEAADAALRVERQRAEVEAAKARHEAAEAARVAQAKAREEHAAILRDREISEAAAKAERERREAAEKKLADQIAAEAKAKAADEAAKRRAERASDTEKLTTMAWELRNFYLPKVRHPDAQALVNGISQALAEWADKIERVTNG
jgi:hypothetical protein